MEIFMKFAIAAAWATCIVSALYVLENAHRLKQSVKDGIQFACFLAMMIFGPIWAAQGGFGIPALCKMFLVVFGYVAVDGILNRPAGPDDSMDIP